jgi:cation diffusion facilitator family transporter
MPSSNPETGACPIHGETAQNATTRARASAAARVFWITLGFNVLVAVGKGVTSWLSGSVALGADAVHSGLDAAANVLAIVGIHVSAAPASARHPYGRRKIELLSALGVGLLILVGLVEVVQAAWQSIEGSREPPTIGWPGFAVVLGGMVISWLVTRYEHRKSHELGSILLKADAQHTESDLYTSGAVLLSFVGASLGLGWLDGACSLVVVLLVGRVAWVIFRENVPMLIDTAVVDPARVRAIGGEVPGVADIHSVRSRGTKWAVELDLHVQVAPDLRVDAAHHIAGLVEDALRAQLLSVCDVVVHIEPSRLLEEGAGAPGRG